MNYLLIINYGVPGILYYDWIKIEFFFKNEGEEIFWTHQHHYYNWNDEVILLKSWFVVISLQRLTLHRGNFRDLEDSVIGSNIFLISSSQES